MAAPKLTTISPDTTSAGQEISSHHPPLGHPTEYAACNPHGIHPATTTRRFRDRTHQDSHLCAVYYRRRCPSLLAGRETLGGPRREIRTNVRSEERRVGKEWKSRWMRMT